MNNLESIVSIALQSYEYIHGKDTIHYEAFELELRRRLMKRYCTIPSEASTTTGNPTTAKFNILHG